MLNIRLLNTKRPLYIFSVLLNVDDCRDDDDEDNDEDYDDDDDYDNCCW